MRRLILSALISLSCFYGVEAASAAQEPTTQTIVFVRHGEKPEKGLGQLSCRGLNRSLKLPAIIKQKFGKLDAIFAPNPSDVIDDWGTHYAYVRPLATVEPTAISLGLPVDTRFGYKEIEKLAEALQVTAYQDATILVGWEHSKIVKIVRYIIRENGGEEGNVPKWSGDDFDSMYVLRITREGEKTRVAFEHGHEGLNGLPESCPTN